MKTEIINNASIDTMGNPFTTSIEDDTIHESSKNISELQSTDHGKINF